MIADCLEFQQISVFDMMTCSCCTASTAVQVEALLILGRCNEPMQVRLLKGVQEIAVHRHSGLLQVGTY